MTKTQDLLSSAMQLIAKELFSLDNQERQVVFQKYLNEFRNGINSELSILLEQSKPKKKK